MDGNKKIYQIIRTVLQHNVSDLHILQDSNLYIRNSSGDIKQVENIIVSRDDIMMFLSDFISKAKLDKLEEGNEIDAALGVDEVRFRVNAYMDKDGVRVALRRISANPPSMQELGLDPRLQDYLLKDKGLILVTGPTGSGKSTTLASMIEFMNQNRKSHIVTLEDPIEFIYKNNKSLITQREVGKNSQSWANAIKYVLRQDPDVVMVGEMRDIETISAVLNLVETGHLVLSTLHTIDTAQTITRIIDVFPAHQQEQIAIQLSLALEIVMSQRLLPLKTGKGRVAAREIMINTPAISKNIVERKISQIASVVETGGRYGMKLMDFAMAELVASGQVDEQVVIPKVKNISAFRSLVISIKNTKNGFNPID